MGMAHHACEPSATRGHTLTDASATHEREEARKQTAEVAAERMCQEKRDPATRAGR